MRTKGAVGKKKAVKIVEEVKPIVTPSIEKVNVMSEIQTFGNEEMIGLVNKVNEIIKFINK